LGNLTLYTCHDTETAVSKAIQPGAAFGKIHGTRPLKDRAAGSLLYD